MSQTISGSQVSRYFERVLGVKSVTAFDVKLPMEKSMAEKSTSSRSRTICLLIEVGSGSDTPSLQQMGSRLLEAIRGEWIKTSPDSVPEMEWIQVEEGDWRAALDEHRSKLRLAIVSGASSTPELSKDVVHVGSFAEMNGSPAVKRDAWRAIQKGVAEN